MIWNKSSKTAHPTAHTPAAAAAAGVVAAGEHGAQQKEKDLTVKLGSTEG